MKKLISIFKPKAQPSSAHGPSFGISLKTLIEKDQSYENDPTIIVPVVFERLASFIEDPVRIRTEGLLRLAGSTKSVKDLKDALDSDPDVDITKYATDEHVVCGALKMFLRELPEPLFPTKYIADLLAASEDSEKIKQIMLELPSENIALLKRLFQLCQSISREQQYTKMGWSNLSLVLTPNLFKSNDKDVYLSDNMKMSMVVHTIMVHFDDIFHDNQEVISEDQKSIEKVDEERKENLYTGATHQSVIDELSNTLAKDSAVSTQIGSNEALKPGEILSSIRKKRTSSVSKPEIIKVFDVPMHERIPKISVITNFQHIEKGNTSDSVGSLSTPRSIMKRTTDSMTLSPTKSVRFNNSPELSMYETPSDRWSSSSEQSSQSTDDDADVDDELEPAILTAESTAFRDSAVAGNFNDFDEQDSKGHNIPTLPSAIQVSKGDKVTNIGSMASIDEDPKDFESYHNTIERKRKKSFEVQEEDIKSEPILESPALNENSTMEKNEGNKIPTVAQIESDENPVVEDNETSTDENNNIFFENFTAQKINKNVMKWQDLENSLYSTTPFEETQTTKPTADAPKNKFGELPIKRSFYRKASETGIKESSETLIKSSTNEMPNLRPTSKPPELTLEVRNMNVSIDTEMTIVSTPIKPARKTITSSYEKISLSSENLPPKRTISSVVSSSAELPTIEWDTSIPYYSLSVNQRDQLQLLIMNSRKQLEDFAKYLRNSKESLLSAKKEGKENIKDLQLAWKLSKSNYDTSLKVLKDLIAYSEVRSPQEIEQEKKKHQMESLSKEKNFLKKEIQRLKDELKTQSSSKGLRTMLRNNLETYHKRYLEIKSLVINQ